MKMFLKVAIWIPVILMAITIFGFSAQNGSQSSGMSRKVAELILDCGESTGVVHVEPAKREGYISMLQTPIRKGAHMSEYAVFCVLVFIALTVNQVKIKLRYKITFAITFLFACSDEIHQLYVPYRSGRFTDVLIDMSGCLIAMALIFLVQKHLRKKQLA